MFRKCSLLLAAMFLAGCSTVNRFDVPRDGEGKPTVKTIMARVTCELANIYLDPENQATVAAADYVVAVELDLMVNDDGSLAPSFTYTNGLFSFNAGAKLDAQREQSYTEQFFFRLKDFDELKKADAKNSLRVGREVNSAACPKVDTPLAGELGIEDTFRMANNVPFADYQTKLNGTKGVFGGYVNFVIVKNLNAVGPTWTLKHFKGPGNLAGVSETNTDKITFAFAERTAAGDEITSLAAVSADVKKRTVLAKGQDKGAKQRFAELVETASTTAAKAKATNLLATIQSTQQTNALINLRGDLH